MEPLSTFLFMCCLSGLNHARAMPNELSGPVTSNKNTPWDDVSGQAAFDHPRPSLSDIIKLYTNAEERDDVPKVPDIDEMLLQKIEEETRRPTAEVASFTASRAHETSGSNARENNKKVYNVLTNQPVRMPEIKTAQANSVITKDCIYDGSNELCQKNNTETDVHGEELKEFAQITLPPNNDNEVWLNSFSDGQELDGGFIRSKDHDKIERNETGSVNKRNFGRTAVMMCNLDTIDIDLRFSENIDTDAGSYLLTCEGSVTVNKCEGLCSSKVSPSVNHVDGFEKVCACCRDASVRTRGVTLTSCVLGTQEVVGYFLSRDIVEPTSCQCRACRN